MSIGNEVTVRMQKQVLKAITSDESPCVDESGYTFHYCDLVKVRALSFPVSTFQGTILLHFIKANLFFVLSNVL